MKQPHEVDIIHIEMIDEDDPAPEASVAAPAARPPRTVPRGAWWLVSAAGAMLVVALLVWQPWHQPSKWRTFDASPAPSAAIDHRLVIDWGIVAERVEPPPRVGGTAEPVIGHVFAVPSATYASRRWVVFRARGTSAPDRPPTLDDTSVHGVQAQIERVRFRRDLTWGPLGGWRWGVQSNLLTETELIAFAEAVGVHNGSAAIERDHDLGDLRPLGTAHAYDTAFALQRVMLGYEAPEGFDATLLRYEDPASDEITLVGSVAASPDVFDFAEFMFGDGRRAVIHGQPAWVIDSRTLGTVVVWFEQGRLIAVAGSLPAAEMVQLAESVRPATDEEWAATTPQG